MGIERSKIQAARTVEGRVMLHRMAAVESGEALYEQH